MKGRPKMIPPAFPKLPTEVTLKILSNLDNRSLFSCRLVSRGWCQVSSTILQDRPSVTVQTSVTCYSSVLWRKSSFSNFIECCKESRKFRHPLPYANFVLDGNCSWILSECPYLEPFLALSKQPSSGLLIKCLSFESVSCCSGMFSNLQDLIFEGAPHLRILCLQLSSKERMVGLNVRFPFEDYRRCIDDKLTVTNRTLPSLRIVQLDTGKGAAAVEFVTRILSAAPNLQKIESPGCGFQRGLEYSISKADDLQPLIDAQKLHLVEKCRFFIYSRLLDSGLLTREKLSGFQPKVLDLSVSIFLDLSQLKSSSEILWTVKDTVEELKTNFSFGLLDNLDFIRFSKLRVWTLQCRGRPIFPPGMKHCDPFPRLEKMCFSFGGRGGTISPAWSISIIPVIPSVHSLKIDSDAMFDSQGDAKGCFEFMTLMCPNTRNLEFFYSPCRRTNFTCVGPLIWTNMSMLQTIVLRKPKTRRYFWNEMEAGFTGFSLETARRLATTRMRKWPKVEDVEHLRLNPSILQMTDLKNLIIYRSLQDVGSASTQFLPLSYKYAFNLMPQLIVEIRTY